MPNVRLCDLDPAFDLVALIEKMTGEAGTVKRSKLANYVEDEKYTQLLEEGFFNRIDKILSAPESEVDACVSLCFSLLVNVETECVSDMILRLAEALSKDNTTNPVLNLRLLCRLFNLLDTPSPLRVTVFQKMIQLAVKSNNAGMLQGEFKKVDQWLKEWSLTAEQQAELYYLMYQSLTQTKSTTMAKFYLIKYLKTFEAADSKRLDTATDATVEAVKSAIADPTLLQCDGLLALATVKNLQNSTPLNKQLHQLFTIVALQSVKEFNAFVAANKDCFAALGLDQEELHDKMRRLSLITLATGKTILAYTEIQQACELADLDEVEEVVINTVGKGSLDAKLDQENEKVHIRRVDQRIFDGGAESWNALGSQLAVWSQNISSVLHHMGSTNRHLDDDLDDR